jgi:TRAP-type C4-dicarboxylate transport system permease small subunit
MKHFLRAIDTSNRLVIMGFRWLATALFGTQCSVMLLQIFMRRIVNRPFVWAEDLVVLLFVWITYLGAAVLFDKGTLITVDLFVMLLPKKLRVAASFLVDILIAGFAVYVCVLASQFLGRQVRLGHKLGGALGLPSWSMTAALVLSIAAMSLSSLHRILNRFGDTQTIQ